MNCRLYVKLLFITGLIITIWYIFPEIAVLDDQNKLLQHIDIFEHSNKSYLATKAPSCSNKRKSLVFVKTHKTGTSTTVNIFYHFGIVNQLNFAVYPYTHQLHIINADRLMEVSSNETYNIMCQHMVFNKNVIESVMPSDSYYVSLLREPIKAFISFFIFYNVDKRYSYDESTSLDTSINNFLDNFASTKMSNNQFIISNNLNSMSYDLGMSTGKKVLVSRSSMEKYMKMLEARFDLVLILERLDESLLLLQHDLCWEPSDVFYLNRMKSKSERSKEVLQNSTLERLKTFLVPDYTLYDTFKARLDKRLQAISSPEFEIKLLNFKESRQKFESDCMKTDVWERARYGSIQHPLTATGKESLHCNILSDPDVELTDLVSLLQDADYSTTDVKLKSRVVKYKDIGSFPRQWKLKSLF